MSEPSVDTSSAKRSKGSRLIKEELAVARVQALDISGPSYRLSDSAQLAGPLRPFARELEGTIGHHEA